METSIITQELELEAAIGPGFRVGSYALERRLGAGGMAEVWLGRHVHLGTPAAVKYLSFGFAGLAEIEQRFIDEGRRQSALAHPNIVKVFGFETVGNRRFLILEFIPGESVEDLLRRSGAMTPVHAVAIAVAALNALDYAHEHNIVHRDVKPSNILLDENRTPYLSDFGIVLATNERRLTRTGTMMGTSEYMSPEQIRDFRHVDRRGDIYSFGCVLYEMLTGEPPFHAEKNAGDTNFAIMLAHVQKAPPSPRLKNASISPQLEAVVLRCLAKKPDDRFSTCRELRDALSAAMLAPGRAPAPPVETWVACTRCRQMVLAGAAHQCSTTIPDADLKKSTSTAWRLGIAAPILAGGGRLVAGKGWSQPVSSAIFGMIVLAGLVLGIIAIRKATLAKRGLDQRTPDPASRRKAVNAVRLGWSAVAAFAIVLCT